MKMQSVSETLNSIYDDSKNTLGKDNRSSLDYAPLVPSINFSTAHAYADEISLEKYHNNKLDHHRYSRDSNPLVNQLEIIFSELYGGQAILFSSGMSAIWSVLWSHACDIDRIYTLGSFYRKTLVNIDGICNATKCTHENFESIEAMKSADQGGNLLIYLESPSNPFLTIVDISKIRSMFPNAVIVYDSTMAGLYNDRKDLSDVDYTVSSVTKYIGGHNDVIGGVVTTKDERKFEKLWDIRSSQGGILDPMSAYLLFRSLKTYDIRMECALRNTEIAFEFLCNSSTVVELYYPGRGQNINQEGTFHDCYYHGGSVITFLLKSEISLSPRLKSLHSSKMAPSFGSTDTLIERPATMSHAGKSALELSLLGLQPNHVRLSVGMEPEGYILKDLERLCLAN